MAGGNFIHTIALQSCRCHCVSSWTIGGHLPPPFGVYWFFVFRRPKIEWIPSFSGDPPFATHASHLSSRGLVQTRRPVFPHFWSFCGPIVFTVPMQQRMWFVALCRLQEGSMWVSKCWCRCGSMCSCVLGCMLPVGHPFAVMKG